MTFGSTVLRRFKADLADFQDVVERRGDLLFQGIAQEVLNEVQVGTRGTGKYSPGTPVDTGYARASWVGGIGAVPTAPPPLPPLSAGPDALLAASQQHNADVLSRARFGDVVYLANPVPYIRRLEYGFTGTDSRGRVYAGFGPKSVNGRSSQAPNGFVRIALAAFDQIARDVALAIRGE